MSEHRHVTMLVKQGHAQGAAAEAQADDYEMPSRAAAQQEQLVDMLR